MLLDRFWFVVLFMLTTSFVDCYVTWSTDDDLTKLPKGKLRTTAEDYFKQVLEHYNLYGTDQHISYELKNKACGLVADWYNQYGLNDGVGRAQWECLWSGKHSNFGHSTHIANNASIVFWRTLHDGKEWVKLWSAR